MKKYRRIAADGMINTDMGGGGQPPQPGNPGGQPQGGPPQQGGDQGGGQPQFSIDVSMVMNANGQQQPLDQMSITKPDDIKQLVQYLIQVFQQVSGGGGQQGGGQPAEGGAPGGGQPQPGQ